MFYLGNNSLTLGRAELKKRKLYPFIVEAERAVTQLLDGQGWSIHVNRVSPANTFKAKNNKYHFCGSVVRRTLQHRRTDQIKYIVSQFQPARRFQPAS
jgi:hypothetical protein